MAADKWPPLKNYSKNKCRVYVLLRARQTCGDPYVNRRYVRKN